jgi:hypothetical protein
MKKILFLKLILPLIFVSFALSCTFSHLKHEVTIDDEVAQLIRNVPSAELHPDAGIIYILDEDIVEVFKDGRYKETVHVVFKILNDKGKDEGDIKSGYDSRTETVSIIYARTITAEGKIVPLNRNLIKVVTPFADYPPYSDYKKLTFSMPGVPAGSIIDYKVVHENKKPAIEGKFSSEFQFQEYNPTYLCRYKVITPKDVDLKYLVLNPLPGIQLSPKIIRNGNKKIYLWEYKHIPQIIEEKSMPPIDEVAFRILVTTMNSWEEFSNWWRKKIEGKSEPDESIKRKVAELTQGLSTSKEKMEVILDYVKREIRGVSGKSGIEPENAQKVFENKYGDCKAKSTLLISMLRAAGISAYYALIRTSEDGNLIKDLPHPFQFNHCIVAVESEAKYHFIDPVGKIYRFDYLPDSDRNQDVLIINDQKIIFEKTPLANPEENAYHSQSQIKIGLDGSIECEVKNFGFGSKDASFRSDFVKNRPREIKQSLEKRVNDISSGARLLTYTHSDPRNFKERFELNIKYDAQDYCRKAGDTLIFDVPEISQRCVAADKKDRRYPIVVWNNYYSKDEAEFNVPEGYKVYHLPEPVEIINQYFEFRSSYRKEGERIFYQGELIRKAATITPEEYASYQKYCQEMGKSFKRSVLFKAKKKIEQN